MSVNEFCMNYEKEFPGENKLNEHQILKIVRRLDRTGCHQTFFLN